MTLQRSTPVVLTIAGSDCTAGAGLQADLKTCAAMGVYACSVVTAVTAQNPHGVQRIEIMSRAMIAAQLSSVMAAYPIAVIKLGMLGNLDVAEEVAHFLRTTLAHTKSLPVVIDPVLSASAGGNLCASDVLAFYREQLFPLATVITPNLNEASLLLDQPIATSHEAYETQALALLEFGSRSALLKGGHSMDQRLCSDYLAQADTAEVKAYSAARLQTPHDHGTGCTLASAIAAGLAQGLSLLQAVAAAKNYLQGSLANAARLQLVPAHGPVHHFSAFW